MSLTKDRSVTGTFAGGAITLFMAHSILSKFAKMIIHQALFLTQPLPPLKKWHDEEDEKDYNTWDDGMTVRLRVSHVMPHV